MELAYATCIPSRLTHPSHALRSQNTGVCFPQPLRSLHCSNNLSLHRGALQASATHRHLQNTVGQRSHVVPIAAVSSDVVPISIVSADDVIVNIPYHIIVYADGRYEKLVGCERTPAGVDPSTGVESKDVVISPEINLDARIYVPKLQNPPVKKLPVLIYFHGGGFITGTSASPDIHEFLNLIAAESNAVIVSVNYRTSPDHYVPACFEDSWEAIKWAAKHADGNGPESWLNEYADLENVFFSGDSAGANISHRMAVWVGSRNPGVNINLKGIMLLNPYFWGKTPVGSEKPDAPFIRYVQMLWTFVNPNTSGLDDPLINPATDPDLSKVGCSKVLVYVAGNDNYKNRGYYYKDVLGNSGWNGNIEIKEDVGVGHVYFLTNPDLESARAMRTRIAAFMNNEA